ncbi:hypothetical protein BG011_008359 [Mortierella polycephala]|uniref:F-box domain-containing protein n=1 Tax=Mortierella polycephala TaxID=41804 RepID=A0A9P6PR83_9FUNG|nr:hypothetical protein BG011_008359 [Mortierella polycephala]
MSACRNQNASNQVFALPEIVSTISRYLDNKTRTVCLRVSKGWSSVWLPILWHSIDAGWQWADDAFLSALRRHGDLIRVLQCGRYDDVRLLLNADTTSSPTCSNLSVLTLPKTTQVNQAAQVQLLRQNPYLRDLALTIQDNPSSHYSDLFDAVGELRFLRRIAFHCNTSLETSTLETVLSRCNGSLEELSLNDTYLIKHPFGSGAEFASGVLATPGTYENPSQDVVTEIKEAFKIQSLSIVRVACLQDLFLNLISRFPYLTGLSLAGSEEIYFEPDIAERLGRRCPKIRNLDISYREAMTDDEIASLIRSLPDLSILRATETQLGDESMDAILEKCGQLEELSMTGTYNVEGHKIQELLQRSSQLKTLQSSDMELNIPRIMADMYQQAASAGKPLAQHMEWACRGIEVLDLRLDYDQCSLSEDERTVYSIVRARHFVYDQLSRLTKLRRLSISAHLIVTTGLSDIEDDGDEEDGNVVDSLSTQQEKEDTAVDDDLWVDFSLRSGLATLAPLKNLRVLDVGDIHHAIGVPEVEWMCQNWPCLREISGLYEDSCEEARAWLCQHKPGIEIGDE